MYELLIATDAVEAFLAELAVLAARGVGGRMSCGIAARTDHGPVTVAGSDAWAKQLDELQFAARHRPVLAGAEQRRAGTDRRSCAPGAVECLRVARLSPTGCAACCRCRWSVDGQILGALNLYSAESASFTDGQRQSAAALRRPSRRRSGPCRTDCCPHAAQRRPATAAGIACRHRSGDRRADGQPPVRARASLCRTASGLARPRYRTTRCRRDHRRRNPTAAQRQSARPPDR